MFDKNLVYGKSQAWLTSQAMTIVIFRKSLVLKICVFWSSKKDDSHFLSIFYLLNSPNFPLSRESAILPPSSPLISMSCSESPCFPEAQEKV